MGNIDGAGQLNWVSRLIRVADLAVTWQQMCEKITAYVNVKGLQQLCKV